MFLNKLFILLLICLIIGFSTTALAQKENLIKKIYAYYPLDANTIDQNKNFSVISTNNVNPGQGKDFITLGENPASGDFFIGAMDELMIWDQILTASEIKSLAY